MNQAFLLVRIVELAKVGGALPAEEALSRVAALIAGLDNHSDTYASDFESLLRIGATLWSLNCGPDGSYDPTWVPPRLRR
ncbi:MAG: hypothetical protein PGN26_08495 [Xylophilus ampelinus]